MGQAAGLAPGRALSELESTQSAAASSSKTVHPPVSAGGQSWRLATAGGDNNARLWMVHPNIPSPAAMASAASVSGSALIAPHPPRVEYLATLSRHSGVVNVVRFCPKGELLATAGDDGNVLFWVPSDRSKPHFGDSLSSLEGEGQFEKEFWRVKLMTRATPQEIYDMAWSPNGETLAVGGTDFVARIINVQDGHVIREISEHSHYVQGIAWDPLNEFLATQSSDRAVHVHFLQTRKHEASGDVVGSHVVSKNSKLDLHRKNGSSSGFLWDAHSKPQMARRSSSHASQASDGEGTRESFVASLRGRSKRSSTPMDPSHSTGGRASTPSGATPSAATAAAVASSGRGGTPSPSISVPPSPFSSHAGITTHAMNPPQLTPSRRSSFSGSNIDVGSPPTSIASLAPGSHSKLAEHIGAANNEGGPRGGSASRSASRTRSIRSPSPIPPLPAIRAPPSPQQRMQAAAASGAGGPLAKASMRLYGDENFSGFFRRLSFSPDGALLVTPSGIFDAQPASPTIHKSSNAAPGSKSAVYLYARGNLSRSNAPIAVLPGHKTATLVVRFSPILYELRKTPRSSFADDGIAPHPTIPLEVGKQKSVSLNTDHPTSSSTEPTDKKATPRGISVIGLPYRMIYAVATQDSVWIYDTQQTGPICCFSNMHYASFTDLSWSPDGQTLMMSSTDGYCSVVVFDYAELGTPYAFASQPSLKTPAPGVPPPAHIAEGKSSAPSTPKASSSSTLAPSSALETPTTSAAPLSGLGLALNDSVSSSNSDPQGPKKKRRIALTTERPL